MGVYNNISEHLKVSGFLVNRSIALNGSLATNVRVLYFGSSYIVVEDERCASFELNYLFSFSLLFLID